MRYIFQQFDHPVLSFSGGKDSTAALEVATEVAREMGRLPLHVIFFDEEAIHPTTIEYVERVMQRDDVRLDWYCLPIKHRNACSQESPWWYCWNPEAEDKWVRPMPDWAISEHPAFEWGMTLPDLFPKLFSLDMGKVGVITGIRSQESLRRYRIVAHKKHDNYITTNPDNKNVYRAHPIYDWSSEDVWVLVNEKGLDYNRTYDIFNMTSMYGKLLDQRVCPPYGEEPLMGLWVYAECFPEMWHRMLGRVPGVATAWRYANTELYSFKLEAPPEGTTWKQYAAILIQNYGDKHRDQVTAVVEQAVTGHYERSQNNLPDAEPDVVSGASWKLICKIIIRGDFKGRVSQAIEQEGEKTRKAMGIGLAEALEKYATPGWKEKYLPVVLKKQEQDGIIIK